MFFLEKKLKRIASEIDNIASILQLFILRKMEGFTPNGSFWGKLLFNRFRLMFNSQSEIELSIVEQRNEYYINGWKTLQSARVSTYVSSSMNITAA